METESIDVPDLWNRARLVRELKRIATELAEPPGPDSESRRARMARDAAVIKAAAKRIV